MASKIVINPVTRISGFLQITVHMEGNRITDAESQGMLFRGFEKMLQGRPPLDVVYFTERICGICSTAHSVAAATALENAFRIKPDRNEEMIRDVLHGSEFLQNHLRHFYQYVLPDYVKGLDKSATYSVTHEDFRIPAKQNEKLVEDYFKSLVYSRKAHEMLAVLGGKAPHNHGVFAGGVTVDMTAQKIVQVKALVQEISDFITSRMVEDAYVIAGHYSDYFSIGTGPENLMSYGVFDEHYVSPGVIINGKKEKLDVEEINENIARSWYKAQDDTLGMNNDNWVADPSKKEGYSFIKAPRYKGVAMQVGPLARMIMSGEYEMRVSTMDRILARVLEAQKVAKIMLQLLDQIQPGMSSDKSRALAKDATGSGFVDTTRGSLAHFLNVKEGKIQNYSIITPSAWNLSPKDSRGIPGALEQALMGTHVDNTRDAVEIGRIVRSFDPCVSCATHVLSNDFSPMDISVV